MVLNAAIVLGASSKSECGASEKVAESIWEDFVVKVEVDAVGPSHVTSNAHRGIIFESDDQLPPRGLFHFDLKIARVLIFYLFVDFLFD